MAENTKIGWADDSVNLWWGCVEVGPGCDNCYARELAKRYGHDVWGVNAPRRIIASAFDSLAKFQKRAQEEGWRRRVFVNSMSDLAEILPYRHPQHREINSVRCQFMANLEYGRYPNLDLIWLTKRIGNVHKVVPANWMDGDWPENLWLLASITDQKEADRDLPKLRAIPAKVRGISAEPLLDDLDLSQHSGFWIKGGCGKHGGRHDIDCLDCQRQPSKRRNQLDWVVLGGESGPRRREMPIAIARSIIRHCTEAGIPLFVKQDSGHREGLQGRFTSEEWAIKQFPENREGGCPPRGLASATASGGGLKRGCGDAD